MAIKKRKKSPADSLTKTLNGLVKTVDSLAIITKNGFEQVEKRFEQVDERFERIDERFEQVDKRFDKLEGRLDSFEQNNAREHEEMRLRLDNVAHRFELVDLEKRVSVLERKSL